MRTIKISGLELDIVNEDQILNMGGPWIGDLLLKGELISETCILDNFFFDEGTGVLYFVKYHFVSRYKWYFAIRFYAVESQILFEFDKLFDMVYLGNLIDKTKLEIYHAFHGQNPLKKSVLDLDQESFKQIY
jgi:hypothetical protein